MFTRLIAALSFTLLSGCALQRSDESWRLKFGLLEGRTLRELRVGEQSRAVPMRADTALPYYGFEIEVPGGDPFTLQFIVYPPGRPAKVEGTLEGSVEDYQRGLRSRIETYVGSATIGFKFNQGDPLGRYRLSILVNGTHVATIEYEIILGEPIAPSRPIILREPRIGYSAPWHRPERA